MGSGEGFERRYSPEQIKLLVRLLALREQQSGAWVKLIIGHCEDTNGGYLLTDIKISDIFINLSFGETIFVQFLFGRLYSVRICKTNVRPDVAMIEDKFNQVLDRIQQYVTTGED